MSESISKGKKELYVAQLEAEKRLCEQSYYTFFENAWENVLEPSTPLKTNWHIEYLCWRMQKEMERIGRKEKKKKDIIINIPPRSLKSSCITMYLQSWVWGPANMPWAKFLTASYDDSLSAEHAVKTRRLIKSNWYQSLWGDVFEFTGDQSLKTSYENDKTGTRIATSVGGRGTGAGGDVIIVDDPLSVEQSKSEAFRKRAIDWWEGTIGETRLNDPSIGVKIIVMQRLHEEDLTGHELNKHPERYEHICLPARIDGDVKPEGLRKKYVNGLLFPDRFTDEMLDRAKKTDIYDYSGQYQQRPSPEEGGKFKKKNWVYWQFPGDARIPPTVKVDGVIHVCKLVELPEAFDEIINSWDMSFKDTSGADPVAGHCWARKGADKYLLDRKHGKMDFDKTVDSVKELRADSGFVTAVLVEDKANGPAIISHLKREVPGMTAVKADVSKEARATPMMRQHASGNIIVPHPDIFPWIKEVIHEFENFPKASTDDDVDAGAHACNFLSDEKHQVVGDYRWNDPRSRSQFSLKGEGMVEISPYAVNFAAVYQQEDLALAHVFTTWDPVSGHLWIYDELLVEYAIPAVAAMQVQQMMRDTGAGIERFLAHDNMFGKRPQERTIVKQYKKYGLKPHKPYRYDEKGAIAMTIQMFSLGRVTLHTKCVETDRQLREWIIEKGKPKKKNIGLCVCICLIVSELDRRFKVFAPAPKIPTYQTRSQAAMHMSNMSRKNNWLAA